MRECILKAIGISKTYNNTIALDNVNLSIQKGNIYGFIGKNGAGKTTFMRIVSGLSIPDKGEIELFGERDIIKLPEQRKRMGCIIENPAFYPYMSAEENMETMRIARGIPDKKVINRVLKLVGLEDTKKKKVHNFSLGMKQRLGIATALLGEPEFLMLDEPINGLDPVSIIEIRELLIKLAREKHITILVSSHILGELYNLVSNYIIINNGCIIEEFTKEELDERCKKHLAIRVNDTAKAVAILERNLKTRDYKIMPDDTITLYDYIDDMQQVITAFSENNIGIKHISVSGDSLENYFINAIGE